MTPTSVGLRRAARGMWNAAARLGIKTQPAMPWGKEVVTSFPWGNTGIQSWGLPSSFVSSLPAQVKVAYLSHEQSLSTCKLNSGEHPLTHSTSQDLRTKCKWSFQSPFLTAVFPLPPNDTLVPHGAGLCKGHSHLPDKRVAPAPAHLLDHSTSPGTLLNKGSPHVL